VIRCRPTPALAFVAGLAATLLLAACGDSTSPDRSLSVAITLDEVPTARVETMQSGGQIITCDLGLTARATGVGTAVWEDGIARFYFGNDRTTPPDSIFVPRDHARLLWGGAPISPSAPQKTGLEVSGTSPFTTSLDFRYRANDGAVKTASITFDCRPNIGLDRAT
jgi:hypothetical protein